VRKDSGGRSQLVVRIANVGRSGPRCNLGQAGGAALSTCLCIHAEENALLEAGRERIGEGSILYCNTQVSPLTNSSFSAPVLTDAQVPVSHLQR
jgi:hypothetical protein